MLARLSIKHMPALRVWMRVINKRITPILAVVNNKSEKDPGSYVF